MFCVNSCCKWLEGEMFAQPKVPSWEIAAPRLSQGLQKSLHALVPALVFRLLCCILHHPSLLHYISSQIISRDTRQSSVFICCTFHMYAILRLTERVDEWQSTYLYIHVKLTKGIPKICSHFVRLWMISSRPCENGNRFNSLHHSQSKGKLLCNIARIRNWS